MEYNKKIMIKMNDEAHKDLEQYKVHFTRAVKGGYTMGITPALAKELHGHYLALGGNKKVNLGCSNCIYTMVKELGAAWMGYTPTVEEVKVEEEKEPIKKGRKKTNGNNRRKSDNQG